MEVFMRYLRFDNNIIDITIYNEYCLLFSRDYHSNNIKGLTVILTPIIDHYFIEKFDTIEECFQTNK